MPLVPEGGKLRIKSNASSATVESGFVHILKAEESSSYQTSPLEKGLVGPSRLTLTGPIFLTAPDESKVNNPGSLASKFIASSPKAKFALEGLFPGTLLLLNKILSAMTHLLSKN